MIRCFQNVSLWNRIKENSLKLICNRFVMMGMPNHFLMSVLIEGILSRKHISAIKE